MFRVLKLPQLYTNTCGRSCYVQSQKFSTTIHLLGRKTRNPYDRRDTMKLLGSDIGPHKPGGTMKMVEEMGRRFDMPQPPGVIDRNGKLKFVPEMVPEFVVPDLTGFELKPYVSYKVPDVKQSEFTAKNLFDAVYGQPVFEKYTNDELDIGSKTVEELLETKKD